LVFQSLGLVAIFAYDYNFMISCDEFRKLVYDALMIIIGHHNFRPYDEVTTNLQQC